jgi:hypothetical protein
VRSSLHARSKYSNLLLLFGYDRFLSGHCGFQLLYCLLQLRGGTAHHCRLMPKPAVRQTKGKKSDVLGRRLFRRVHIADIGAVIDTSLAGDSLSNTDIAAAVDVRTGRTSQARVVVAADVAK